MTTEWYYLDADEAQIGPVGLAVVSSFVEAGTMVWTEGMADWSAVRELPADLRL